MSDEEKPSRLAAVAILVVAGVVRLPGIATWPFEPDELSTWRDALHMAGPSANGPGALGRPVYYALEHVLLALAPGSPLALRLPALVFGLAGVWLTWVAGRRLFGPVAGIVAASLVALSPWHQYASGFARYWTLVYVLCLLAVLWTTEALDTGSVGRLRMACAALTLGALTHPTFLFPVIGLLAGLHLVDREGGWRLRIPSRPEWLNLWLPFAVLFGGWLVWLKESGNGGALSNWSGRGLGATLRVFAGMAEWLTPAVVVAVLVGLVTLARSNAPGARRWALVAAAGLVSGSVLLFFAGRRTDVYADYGMAMLPLVYLTVGAAAARWLERPGGGLVPWGAALVLTAGALPGVVSNLRDGMRFDYRPAFAFVRSHGAGRLVLGPSLQLQRYYAPDLSFEEIGAKHESLAATLSRTGGFWLILANHRGGWMNGDAETQAWVDGSCHVVQRSGTGRLDYREYDVQLAWCGSAAP